MDHERLVFVADDNDDMRVLLELCLRKRGYDVRGTSDGSQLLQDLELARRSGTTPDLVVSDLQMPHASGLEVLNWIRDRCPEVPVILISAYADRRITQRATELGAVVLHKPFEISQLLEMSLALANTNGHPQRTPTGWLTQSVDY